MAGPFDGLAVAQSFLDTVLKADAPLLALATGGIRADFSLETTPGTPVYPLVNYFNMSGGIIRAMGSILVATNPIYAVMVHGTGGYGVISPLVVRVITLLDNVAAYPVTFGGLTLSVNCQRVDDIQTHPDVLPGGQVAYARGIKIRLFIQSVEA